MQTRKSHPRSLDALFPKPKPPRVRRCANGHKQSVNWRPAMRCLICERDSARERLMAAARKEREEWGQRFGGAKVLEILVVTSGKIRRYAIPRHLTPRKPRGHRPRRRSRI